MNFLSSHHLCCTSLRVEVYYLTDKSPLPLADHRLRRKSIATGKQPSMEVPPTAPLQPFRQSVSNPAYPRPRSLPPSLSLSLVPHPALGPSHTCGRRVSGTPPHPFPLSLAVPPPNAFCPQQQQKGSKKGSGTPPLARSLPLSPSLSFTLPHSPAASSPSPYLYWGGDWTAAGSNPVAGGMLIAPLPPVEVRDSEIQAVCSNHRCSDSNVLVARRSWTLLSVAVKNTLDDVRKGARKLTNPSINRGGTRPGLG